MWDTPADCSNGVLKKTDTGLKKQQMRLMYMFFARL